MRRWWQNLLSGGICCSLNGMEEGLLGSTERFDSDLQYLTSRPSSYLNGIARKGYHYISGAARPKCSDRACPCQENPRYQQASYPSVPDTRKGYHYISGAARPKCSDRACP